MIPFKKESPTSIFIDGDELKKNDCEVHAIVRASLQKVRGANYKAKIEEVFSGIDDPELEFQIVAENNGFPFKFSDRALKEAEEFSKKKPGQRADLTLLPIVTIDGEDARDFDDAIHVEMQKDGSFKLLVSIADVSFFVEPESTLDREAQDRATSIYLPGRVVPMLPEVLSNDVCSLVPNKERAAITCEMTFSNAGKRLGSRVFESVIKSHARLTYKQVERVLDDKKVDDINPEILEMLRKASRLAALLKDQMRSRGYLELDLPEKEVKVDYSSGEVKSLNVADRLEAHKLIEVFMIAANEAVSEAIESKNYGSIYRVHGEPSPEKLERLKKLLKKWNIDLPAIKPGRAIFALQRVLNQTSKHPNSKIISFNVLRSLQQAQYSTSNAGHFGLGSTSYCHFTSPIRRYPDLITHRILRDSRFLKTKKEPIPLKKLQRFAEECSSKEQRAVSAERQMVDIKTARYMSQFIGKTYDAIIISPKSFGFFVEIEPHLVEGLVPKRTLPYDHWDVDEHEYELRGKRSGTRFCLGDRVKVQLVEADRFRHQLSFRYIRHLDGNTN